MSVEVTAAAPLVRTARDGGIASLALNRPERFNPLSAEMIDALQAEFDAIAGDASVRVVILGCRGAGVLRGPRPQGDARAHGQ